VKARSVRKDANFEAVVVLDPVWIDAVKPEILNGSFELRVLAVRFPLMALFGPERLAKRLPFTGVKRTPRLRVRRIDFDLANWRHHGPRCAAHHEPFQPSRGERLVFLR
jgi:hypothetical protein